MRPIPPALALVALGLPCLAADFSAAPSAPAPVRPAGILSELRFGGSAQDPWSSERGTANVNGEVLLARPALAEDRFWSVFVPRPTLGGSFNLAGRTSYGYVGATWTVDVTERVFVEGFLGVAVHDGATGRRAFVPPRLNALGCSPLFREAAALGVRLSARWSVMATVEHASNAGLCVENRGLTTVGAKIAYTF